jgi:flavodoxin I
MKTLVIYDSAYGNTAQIARAIGEALGSPPEVVTLQVGDVTADHLAGLRLLIVGSPTQRFSSTPGTKNFLDNIPEHALKGVRVAAFDTRFTREHMKSVSSVLSFSAGLVGDSAYAAKSIASGLKKKGGELVAPPEGFYVKDTEGPLLEGELERAAEWARRISQT